ncbi:MAG TPA: glycosyltransferase [Acidimicrobiales bacterium]|nr:glycosyltransferase [Acidimicrobiales bacterium]
MSRRILFACSLGGAGHFNPLRPLIEACERRGDEVLVVVPPSLEPTAAASGHPYVTGGEPSEEAVAVIKERLAKGPPEAVGGLVDKELFGRQCTAAMLPAMTEIFEAWRPHLVLRESCEYASAIAAARAGVPHGLVAISLAAIEYSVLELVTPVLASHNEFVVEQIRAGSYVSQLPQSLDPSPFVDTRRYRPRTAVSPRPLADWWDGSQAPLLYVTFGSVAGSMSIAPAVFRTALAAVAGVEARVLLTVGRRFDLQEIGQVPANVHVEAWVPQDSVLPRAAAVLCHGGSGTTFGALAAGVPLVIAPLFADQLTNGPLVAESGAGLCVEISKSEGLPEAREVAALAEAVTTVLTEPRYRQAAERIAEEMSGEPDADKVLERLLSGVAA